MVRKINFMPAINKNIRSVKLETRTWKLQDRVALFNNAIATKELTYLRTVLSAADREVLVKDRHTGKARKMLMFASNNYLGLANHPYVNNRVKKAIDEYGCGIGGPPLLNGYLKLIEETEERLAALKDHEAAMLFSSGFMANVGLINGLVERNDLILYDELSHASFFDGIKSMKVKAVGFSHNDEAELEALLIKYYKEWTGSVFVFVEGVYSMNGNMARLGEMSLLCKKYGALLIVDDAHGTGVLGENGRGTASLLNCSSLVEITIGTFSKAFASCGGFLTGAADTINYLRFHSRPYIFSASIPPPVAGAVLGGLDVLEQEPWLRTQLLDNVQYTVRKLRNIEFCATPEAAIIALKLPDGMDIRKASCLFDEKNIFINPIEYPAVAVNDQRFRISIMATHTREDLDKLAEVVEEVWNNPCAYAQ
jgi:glycine C-acetyltransferase